MGKFLINLSIFIIFLTTLMGCSSEVPNEVDSNQLTRVDVQIYKSENSDNETIIAEEEKIKILREVFARIEWEQNIKAEMALKEDVKATLFFRYDKNMPERLFVYLIWFNQGGASVTIIDREKNALGTLDKEDAQALNDLLLNN